MDDNKEPSDATKNTLLEKDFEELLRENATNKDTQCGFLIFKGEFLQKLASKKMYIIIHGITGLFISSTFSYLNGTVTTLEKRYKIPSQNIGVILVGFDVSAIFCTPILCHLLARKHRPRWIAISSFVTVIYCYLMAALHFIYGPGEDALSLTTEYGASVVGNSTSGFIDETLCLANSTIVENKLESSSFAPQIYLFAVQVFVGIFGSTFDNLGLTYMDDNIQKSKAPMLLSISYFVRMIGPAIGYTMTSFSLKYYIEPNLTPIITTTDSRWLGAWWIGWLIIGTILMVFSFFVALFPKELPRAAVRRMISVESQKLDEKSTEIVELDTGMIATFKRLFTNKVYVFNNFSGVCFYFSAIPYWIFMPKYIETMYRQTASFSNFVTGSFGLIFTALGVLGAGSVLSKYKPSAQKMAAWNVFVGVCILCCSIAYMSFGCDANDNSIIISEPIGDNASTCISNCQCDFVKFSPVCGADGHSYISPCHAGCTHKLFYENGTKYYVNCGCITIPPTEVLGRPHASEDSCAVDCYWPLIYFVIVSCLNQFLGSTSRVNNFLISVRCIREEDKTVSMGLTTTFCSLFAFIPSPVFFGWLMDQTCSVWGKTATGTGNCWLYDVKSLRYLLNSTAIVGFTLSIIIDSVVWYYCKGLKIFDENEEKLSVLKKIPPIGDVETVEMKSLKFDELENEK